MAWFVRRVIFIAFPVIEILLIFWVAGKVGWLWVVLALFAGVVVGVSLIRAAGRSAFQLLRRRTAGESFVTVDPQTGQSTTIFQPATEAYQPGVPPDPETVKQDTAVVRESGLLVTAGVLFMIPGFLTDIAGVVLALPQVRRGLVSRRPPTSTPGVIIPGVAVTEVVVDEQGADVGHWKQPEKGPQIISGEILPPRTGE